MAHFTYTRPSGTWATLYVPTASDFSSLDQKSFKSVNGDDGGTWAPSSAIIVGGSGMQIPSGVTWSALGTFQIQSGGLVEVQSGGTLQLDATSSLSVYGITSWKSGSIATWASGSDAFFASGSTLEIFSGCAFTLAGTMTVSGTIATPGSGIQITDATNPTFVTARTKWFVQPLIVNGPSSGLPVFSSGLFVDTIGSKFYSLPLGDIIDGATLAQVVFGLNSGPTPSTSGNAGISIYKTNVTALTVAGVAPGASLQIGSTIAIPPLTANTQSAIAVSGAGEVIDKVNFSYWGQITSSAGTGAQQIFWYPLRVQLSNITHMGQV